MVSVCNIMVFNLGSAKVSSLVIFEIYLSYDKDLWFAATEYYMYFYLIVLFPLASIL